jgi:HEAT repeat protein
LSQAILDDEDSAVRTAAVEALGRIWNDGAVDPLALALLGDEDPTVREEAALALGETWSDAAVEPLVDLAALEAFRVKLLGDEEYWAIVNKARKLFVEGSFYDSVLAPLD